MIAIKPGSSVVVCFLACMLLSCNKNDSNSAGIIPTDYKAYPDKITTQTVQPYSQLFQYTYDISHNCTGITSIPVTMNYSYNSNRQVLGTGCYYNPAYSHYVKYDIAYDSSNQPVYGIRTYITGASLFYNGPSQAPSSVTNTIDSIRFKINNGKVAEVRFFDRRSAVSHYPNFPSFNGLYWDTTLTTPGTLETYQISYSDENISKIHSEDRAGKTIDREYTYGTKRGIMHDCRIQPLFNPDLILQYPYAGLAILWNQAKNDLLTMKNIFVTENNRVESTSFVYTYDQYTYPLTVTITGPATSSTSIPGTTQLKFSYK